MSGDDKRPPTCWVGILVFDGFEPIDVFGFAEAFSIARYLGQGYASPGPYPFCITLIARSVESSASRTTVAASGPTSASAAAGSKWLAGDCVSSSRALSRALSSRDGNGRHSREHATPTRQLGLTIDRTRLVQLYARLVPGHK